MTLFHATLNNLVSVTTLIVGSSIGVQFVTSPVNHFVDGSIRFNSKDDHLGYQEFDGSIVNWPAEKGSLKFMMRPRFTDTNNEKLTFFQRGPWLSSGMLEFGKHAAINRNTLRLITVDASGLRTDSEIAQVHWAAQLEYNVWSQVEITWDWNSPEGVQCYHVYINGVDMPFVKVAQGQTILPGPLTGQHSFVAPIQGQYFYLGSRGPGSVFRANMDAKELILEEAL